MTAPPPKPKRRCWRWLVVIAFVVATAAGLQWHTHHKEQGRHEWMTALREASFLEFAVSLTTPKSVPEEVQVFWQGPLLTEVLVRDDKEATRLISIAGECPPRMLILTSEAVSQDALWRLHVRYPSASVEPLFPRSL